MFIDTRLGNLTEPLSGRRWDREMVFLRLSARISHYRKLGISCYVPVFIHYGNTMEFFVDLLAVWLLGGCVIPIDPQMSRYEVENLARAAAPRFSLWLGPPDEPTAGALAGMGIRILDTSEIPEAASPGSLEKLAGNFVALDDPGPDPVHLRHNGGIPRESCIPHRSLRARWNGLRQALGTETFRRTLCLLPTHLGHGLICNCLFPWFSGQDLFILPPFRPETIIHLGTVLDNNEITFMSSVPSVMAPGAENVATTSKERVETGVLRFRADERYALEGNPGVDRNPGCI